MAEVKLIFCKNNSRKTKTEIKSKQFFLYKSKYLLIPQADSCLFQERSSIFARIMTKCLSGILFCAVLLFGLQEKTDAGLKGLRSATVTVVQGVSSPLHLLPDNLAFTFKAAFKQAACHNGLWNSERADPETVDRIPEELVHSSNRTVPYRLWNDAIPDAAGRLPHLSDIGRDEDKRPVFLPMPTLSNSPSNIIFMLKRTILEKKLEESRDKRVPYICGYHFNSW